MATIDTDAEELSSWLERVARLGWVARGVTYLVLGLITIGLATGEPTVGSGGEDADQRGALAIVADLPWSGGLLVALAFGLLLFAVWQGVQLLSLTGRDSDAWIERGAKILGVAFYGWLSVMAIDLALGAPPSQSRSGLDRATAAVLGHPLGRAAAVVVGCGVLAVAVRRARRTATGDFGDELDLSSADRRIATVVEWVGRVGEIGRATSFVVIAFFVIGAGLRDRPADAGGLDQSLGRAATSVWGARIVLLTGMGFVVFGVFSAVSARWRQLDTDGLDPPG